MRKKKAVKPLTHVAIVIDESGSMAGLERKLVRGTKVLFDTQKFQGAVPTWS